MVAERLISHDEAHFSHSIAVAICMAATCSGSPEPMQTRWQHGLSQRQIGCAMGGGDRLTPQCPPEFVLSPPSVKP